MNAKTIKLANYNALDDSDLSSVQKGVSAALAYMNNDAAEQGREVLWGTLEIEIEQRQIDQFVIAGNVRRIHSNNRVVVSALAVLK